MAYHSTGTQSYSRDTFRFKYTSSRANNEKVQLEFGPTTVSVNEKLLPHDVPMISSAEPSTIRHGSRISFESVHLWFRLFIVNDLSAIFILFLWLIINIAIFIGQFLNYHNSLSYFYLRSLISDGLSTARAAALCLNFNCFLILFPVCRNLISLIRYILPKCITQSRFRRFLKRVFDQNVGFHRCIGYAICFWSLVHVGAHVYNYERLIDIHNEYQTLPSVLSLLYLQSPDNQVNPYDRVNPNSLNVGYMLITTAGITGVILCICLLMIFSSSTALIRRSYYEIFWYTHHLFVVFFVCLILHGFQGIIRFQTNTKEHNPETCASLYREWGINQQCLVYPNFTGSLATSWMWLCTPLAIYFVERCLRFARNLQRIEILDVIRHASNVIEIRFCKRFMKTPQPGQYIYLKCFSVSKLEWHPFTVTSASEESFISVHIRTAGNWTKALSDKLQMYPQDIPRFAVDGPYGNAADDVFNYDGVILVGAGIGGSTADIRVVFRVYHHLFVFLVTPYAAILKHIRSSQMNQTRLRRVYFYWICNTTSCYEWFAEMLQQIEHEFRDRENFLTYNIYLTKWSMGQARAVVQNNEDERDIWTGLESKTHYGRPNFNIDFQTIINEDWQMTGKRCIGVFVCGPKQLAKQLQYLCIKINDQNSSTNKVRFYLNKENF